MRTVSFSNREVRSLLNDYFVNTFTNTEGDPTAGMSIRHRPSDPAGQCIRGNGKQNLQTIFMTPDGEIFHVATGFVPPNELVDEIKFALQLFREISKAKTDNAEAIVSNAHRDRLKDLGFSDDEINARPGLESFMQFVPNANSNFSEQKNNNSLTRDNRFSASSLPQNTVFGGFIKRQILEDNQFMVNSPLIDYRKFESDPGQLVGNGKSFFASSSSK